MRSQRSAPGDPAEHAKISRMRASSSTHAASMRNASCSCMRARSCRRGAGPSSVLRKSHASSPPTAGRSPSRAAAARAALTARARCDARPACGAISLGAPRSARSLRSSAARGSSSATTQDSRMSRPRCARRAWSSHRAAIRTVGRRSITSGIACSPTIRRAVRVRFASALMVIPARLQSMRSRCSIPRAHAVEPLSPSDRSPPMPD